MKTIDRIMLVLFILLFGCSIYIECIANQNLRKENNRLWKENIELKYSALKHFAEADTVSISLDTAAVVYINREYTISSWGTK